MQITSMTETEKLDTQLHIPAINIASPTSVANLRPIRSDTTPPSKVANDIITEYAKIVN